MIWAGLAALVVVAGAAFYILQHGKAFERWKHRAKRSEKTNDQLAEIHNAERDPTRVERMRNALRRKR